MKHPLLLLADGLGFIKRAAIPLLVVSLGIIGGLTAHLATRRAECSDAGGVLLRPVFGSWECYDAGSLKTATGAK